MSLTVDIQCASSEPVPDEDDIRRWIEAALLGQRDADTEISLRLVDIEEMTNLNQSWRGKRGPTNVLSFPAELPGELDLPLLGDIVICAPVVAREAREQGKALDAHWAHMVIHGTLHLLGYDHIEEHEAAAMETLETAILARLNYPCPYRGEHSEEPLQA
jgi:probable rRNA maturation factor